LFNKAGGFTSSDLELLTAIASSASIAIDNARLYQEAVEKGRLERELQTALQIQTGLLPGSHPQILGWDFATFWQPARQVSGDYYDFVILGDPQSGFESAFGLVIADVTDKGMPAALFMAYTRSIVRASLHQIPVPHQAITQANRLICDESTHGLFVTMFYGELDPSTGELIYVNAGHNPPLHYQSTSGKLERLMPTGIPLGAVEDFGFKQARTVIEEGDFIFFYTDGITEAINADEDEFGLERLEQIVLANCRAPTRELAEVVDQAVVEFARYDYSEDDKTILVIRRLPSG
jgi:sigma-B regulation protein RsbU (phosphoserine phosphatase)